jgi:DNA-binding MarR family transcriptional regulator
VTEADGRHARHRLDAVIHAPVRFSIVAALARVDEAEFAHVRDTIEVSDSVLSKQATQLEAAGYVKVRKGYVGKRPRTWLSLTSAGRAAYARHLAGLRAIAGEAAPDEMRRPQPARSRRPHV